jgi:hypothetical protein
MRGRRWKRGESTIFRSFLRVLHGRSNQGLEGSVGKVNCEIKVKPSTVKKRHFVHDVLRLIA